MIGRWVEFGALLVASWCVMVFTHEAGHLVGGWLGGATLVEADLRPWRLPYSIHRPDPRPLMTLWSGPVLGVAMPVSAALTARHRWAWFVADFCVLANGVYLTVAWGSGDRFLDTPRLLNAGAHPATIALFCVATIAIGYVRFRVDCRRVISGAEGARP